MASTSEPQRSSADARSPRDWEQAAAEEPVDTEPSLSQRFFHRRTLLSFLVGFGLLAFFFARLDLDMGAVWGHLRGVNLGVFALGVGAYFLSFPVRGLRWRLLLTNVGLDRGGKLPSVWGLAEIILIGWFANCIVPAKLGDAYRAYLLKKHAQVSFSSTAGTVVAERLADMMVLFGLLCLSALTLLGGVNQDKAALVVGLGFVLFLGIVSGIGLMRFFGHTLSHRLPARLQPMYLRFHEGTLGSFRQLPLLVVLTIVVWLLEASRMYLVTRSLNLSLDFPFILFVALANSLLTVVPFTPGGLGLVENGAAELFLRAGVPKELAFSLVLLDRGISYWGVVGSGFLVFLFSKKK
ncbi:MAG: flippase-like domain-containing protein [Chloroflexi bacterium]|nr:flippase-like domain-containing protein [Chloroflexota bacterium]